MITQCPYQIDNNDRQKNIIRVLVFKIISCNKTDATTKEIYDFLK